MPPGFLTTSLIDEFLPIYEKTLYISIGEDHIFTPALAGLSPLVGLNDSRFGERFVSLHDAYDKSLRNIAKDVAKKNNMRLFEGVYVMSGGPQYETPAEVVHPLWQFNGVKLSLFKRLVFITVIDQLSSYMVPKMVYGLVAMFKTVGGDALGMSTCHEVTVAQQCGIKVLGFSLITNIANLNADTSKQVSHEEVLKTAKDAGTRASQFVKEIISSSFAVRQGNHQPLPLTSPN
uniref:purine-nucleoside phosphorylase n=1 Tax=Angiostrongylus cantonensis TaxID=6313 RepID=A0A0K0DRK8_ANGCA